MCKVSNWSLESVKVCSILWSLKSCSTQRTIHEDVPFSIYHSKLVLVFCCSLEATSESQHRWLRHSRVSPVWPNTSVITTESILGAGAWTQHTLVDKILFIYKDSRNSTCLLSTGKIFETISLFGVEMNNLLLQ